MPPTRTPPKEGEPKTLFEARELIKKLRGQMPGTSAELKMSTPPVPGMPGVPSPDPVPRPRPDPSAPGSPGTARNGPGNVHRKPPELTSPAPKVIGAVLEQKSLAELYAMLAAETGKSRKLQDSNMVACLYREIKKR